MKGKSLLPESKKVLKPKPTSAKSSLAEQVICALRKVLSDKSKTYSFFSLNSSIFNQLFKHITSFIVSGNNLFLFDVINSPANENFSSIGTLVPGIAR